MFNTYKIDNSYRGPEEINVTEKKAPTDESIRLLNEFQQKAFDNIVECVQLSNNELTDAKYWIYPDHYSFTQCARIRFKLNGKVKDFEFTLPHERTDKADIQKIIMSKIYDEITKEIFSGFVDKTLTSLIDIYKR